MEPDGLHASLGNYSGVIPDALARARQDNVVHGIWNKDAALWKTDEAHQKIIRNSLLRDDHRIWAAISSLHGPVA